MSRLFQTISNSELEDFRIECMKFNVDPDEFQLDENDITTKPYKNGLFTINGKITISRKSFSNTYVTGNNTHYNQITP